MTIQIKQAISGSSYYEATTQHGTMARESLSKLKAVLTWIYGDGVVFSVSLADIPVSDRRYCPDA